MTASPPAASFGSFPSSIPNLTGWQAAQVGTSFSTLNFLAGDTSSLTTDAIYSFGAGSDSNRALGTAAKGVSTEGGFGVEIVNDTALPINQFTVAIQGEVWNRGDSAGGNLTFAYGSTGSFGTTTSSGFLGSSAMIGDAPLSFAGTTATGDTHGPYVFPLVSNLSDTITPPAPLQPGQSLFLRWRANGPIGDVALTSGLAIDNFQFSAVVPEPASVSALLLSSVAVLLKRHRRRLG